MLDTPPTQRGEAQRRGQTLSWIAVLGLIITTATFFPVGEAWAPEHEPVAMLVRIAIASGIVGLLVGMPVGWRRLVAPWQRSRRAEAAAKLGQMRAQVQLLSQLLGDLRSWLYRLEIVDTIHSQGEVLLVLSTDTGVPVARGDMVIIVGAYSRECMGVFEIDQVSAGCCAARCIDTWDDGVYWWAHIRARAIIHAPPQTTAAAYLMPRRGSAGSAGS